MAINQGNLLPKEIRVSFAENIINSFQDQSAMWDLVGDYNIDGREMFRSDQEEWVDKPEILTAYEGLDITSQVAGSARLVVPVRLDREVGARPLILTERQMADAPYLVNSWMDTAKQTLKAYINGIIIKAVAGFGNQIVRRTGSIQGHPDLGAADVLLTSQGISPADRRALLPPQIYQDFLNVIGAKQDSSSEYFSKAYKGRTLGMISNFDAFKSDIPITLTAAVATGVTINGANQYWVPTVHEKTVVAGVTRRNNVDSRVQQISITKGGGGLIKVGDCFTIAGVNALHPINKEDTGQLRTFRVTQIISGGGGTGVIEITPPIVARTVAGGGNAAEENYRNVTAAPANGAVVTFLNTATSQIVPFFHKDAVKFIPGKQFGVSGKGVEEVIGTLDNGLSFKMSASRDIQTYLTTYRIDCWFGVSVVNPDAASIVLFNQV